MISSPPVCYACTRFIGGGDEDQKDPPTCTSFPEQIPNEIFYTSGALHNTPVGGEEEENGKPLLFELNVEDPFSIILFSAVVRLNKQGEFPSEQKMG
jgi:hypothetical protein